MSENTVVPEKSPEKKTKDASEKKTKDTSEKKTKDTSEKKTKDTAEEKTNESPEKKKSEEEVSLEGKKSKGTTRRPTTSEMVDAAIFALAERGGSSLTAIKKYIGATFNIDATKSSLYIRRYLIESVDSGHLIQIKGTGASGSFKLSAEAKRLAERSAGIANRIYLPKKPSKRYAKSSHPPFYQMVDTAIITLNEKYGSSLKAVKKYLAEHYKVDTKKKSSYIRRYINSALENGQYVQTKGSGASGSFRIPHSDEDRKKMAESDDNVVKKKAKPVKRLKKPKSSQKSAATKKSSDSASKAAKPKKPVAAKPKTSSTNKRKKPTTPTQVEEKPKPEKRGPPKKRAAIPEKPERSAPKTPVSEKLEKPKKDDKKDKHTPKKSSSPPPKTSSSKRRGR